MVSRNNIQEKIRKIEEKKEHRAIRKLTMGAASVLIGLSFMGATGRAVKATTTESEEVVVQTDTQVENENPAAQTETQNVDSNTQENVQAETPTTDTKVAESSVNEVQPSDQEEATKVIQETTVENTETTVDKTETVKTDNAVNNVNQVQDSQKTDTVEQTNQNSITSTKTEAASVNAKADETTKPPTYADAVDKVENINNGVKDELDKVVDDARKVEGVVIDKKDPIDIITNVTDIDKNKDLLEKYTQEQIAAIKKELEAHQAKLEQYKDDLKKYNEARDAYIARLKELGLWKDGEHTDPDDLSQKLVLGKEENAQIKVDALQPGVTQGTGSMLNGLLNNFWQITPDKIDGDFLKVTYTQLSNSYYNDELLSKIEVIFSDWESSNHSMQANRKPGIYFGKSPTDGFFYVKANGVTMELKMYDSKGKLINLQENTAFITVGSLNSQGTGSDYIEKAKIINGNGFGGSGIALPESSITVHPGANGDILFSDMNNDALYNKNITAAQKQELIKKYGEEFVNKYLGWDDSTDRSKEIFGSGLFKVHGSSIKIRFSNQLGSAWATFSTTIPKITFDQEKPEAPTLTITVTPQQLVLKKNSSVHIHYVDVHDAAMNGVTEFTPEHGIELTDKKQSHTHLAVDDLYTNELWDYLSANYILATETVHPGALGGTITDDEQHHYVYLKRKTETVNRDKVVNQTIHYVYEDGSEAAPTHVSVQLVFTQTGTKDLVNGTTTWDGEWTKTQTFVTVTSPKIDGYTADKLEVGPYDITVTNDNYGDNLDKVDIVTYTKNTDQPTQPTQPTDPDQPTDPQPTTPEQPTTPDQPTDPQPTQPTTPDQPTTPEPDTPVTSEPDMSDEETSKPDDVMPKPEKDTTSGKDKENAIPKKEEVKQTREATVTPKKETVTFTKLSAKTTSSETKTPVQNENNAQENTLPQTGVKESKAGIVGLLLAALGSVFGLVVRKTK